MSKQQTKGFQIEDFGHVNDGLLKRAAQVVADKARRTFSSSGIYRTHNELFKLKETPQTCESCLVTRATKIANWYDWYAKLAAPQTPAVQIPVPNAGTGDEPNPAAAQATYDLEGGQVMTVNAEGLAMIGDTAALEGPYRLTDGNAVVVGVDGKIVNAVQITGGAPDSMPAVGEDGFTDEQRAAIAQQAGGQVGSEPTAAPQIILQKVNKDNYAPEGDALFGIFTASEDDATKGTVVNAETGKALAAGTYATEDVKQVLSVSVGGKAAYKAV